MTKRKKFIVAAVVIFCIAAVFLSILLIKQGHSIKIHVVFDCDENIYAVKMHYSTEMSYNNGTTGKSGYVEVENRISEAEREQGKGILHETTISIDESKVTIGDDPPDMLQVSFFVSTVSVGPTELRPDGTFKAVGIFPLHLPVKVGGTSEVRITGNAVDGYSIDIT